MPNIQLLDAVKSLSTRYPFNAGKSLLQSLGFPVSLGWERTFSVTKTFNSNKPGLAKRLTTLVDEFSTHCLVGEKLVRQYIYTSLDVKVKKAYKAEAAKNATSVKIPKSEFLDVYPLAIQDQAELQKLDGIKPTLTAVAIDGTQVVFVFCSVRSYHEQVPLDIQQFDQKTQAKLHGISELIGVKHLARQCFDVVVFSLIEDLVEIRIDAPVGLPTAQQQYAALQIIDAFHALKLFADGWQPMDGGSWNYHSAIGKLYQAKGEGKVFQLGFTANTKKSSSNNGARLLRKKGQDLRSDEFHVGGVGAVKDIDPYTIGVEWAGALGTLGAPKLIIPGSASMLYKSPVIFPEIVIRDCYSLADFALVSAKLAKYR